MRVDICFSAVEKPSILCKFFRGVYGANFLHMLQEEKILLFNISEGAIGVGYNFGLTLVETKFLNIGFLTFLTSPETRRGHGL